MKSKVYITRKLPEEIVHKLSAHFEISMWEEESIPVPREVLIKEIEFVNGLFCLLTDVIDDELLENGKRLKIISNMAVGYNNIDIDSATRRGIIVTNTPGVLTETTADLTFALLMATARKLFVADAALRNGKWGAWTPMEFTGQDVYGATIGIIGLGRIGQALVKRAKGFDMKVLYYNRSRKREIEEKLNIEYAELNTLLQKSDFVCLMLPYSPETHHLIGKSELALMKKEAILINTARGGIVDEDALYEALISNQIWAAGLDVFEQEPVPIDHPLLTLNNVVTLPHIGSASIQTRMNMANLAAENLIQFINGKGPITPVL